MKKKKEKEIEIISSLYGKERLFKVLTLAELSNLPALLIGDTGSGKTQAFFDFAISKNEPYFVKQLNFDTKIEDIIGYINIIKFKEGIVERINGIENKKFILIDEIDKASSTIQNLFLSIINEKKLFNGEKIVPLNWSLFIGTTNTYSPDMSENHPFFDRFVIKFYVEKISVDKINELIHSSIEKKKYTYKFYVHELSDESFKKALQLYKYYVVQNRDIISDRTIYKGVDLLKNVLKLNNNEIETSVVETLFYILPNIDIQEIAKAINL